MCPFCLLRHLTKMKILLLFTHPYVICFLYDYDLFSELFDTERKLEKICLNRYCIRVSELQTLVRIETILTLVWMKTRVRGIDLQCLQWHALYNFYQLTTFKTVLLRCWYVVKQQ